MTASTLQFLHLYLTDIVEEGAERLQEEEYQEVCCEILSHRNSCINKIQAMAISIDLLISNGGGLTASHL